MAKLILCSAAEVDFTESLCWYSDRSQTAAENFDAAVHEALLRISEEPERFPFCDDRHRFLLMRHYPFRIIYRIVGQDVVVLAIAHASRAPDYWENR